jgi:polysaccharide deacetylase 2 family uncharacterized protein YibQ
VADDDLSAPLGQNRKKKRWRVALPITAPQAIAGLLGLILFVFAAWAVTVRDPLGGEPMAVVDTGFDPPKQGATLPKVVSGNGAAQNPNSYNGPAGGMTRQAVMPTPGQSDPPSGPPPGTRTVTIIDGSTGKRQEVAIPGAGDVRAPVEQRLLEASRYGAIPRIGTDGARPADVYAHPLSPAEAKKNGPRIAIVLGGLGISTSATRQALDKLPAAITFAFPPYGAGVDGLATSARAAGHDVLLQAAMEPFDYPDNDPGPQTLLTSIAADQNLDRLHWQMSRLQGYVGIANYMGARFTSTETALAPVLKDIARRGLIYIDDGMSPRSLAGQIAGANNVPFAKAEVVLDAVPTPTHIDRALMQLEGLARAHGSAIGIASAMPASIGQIAQWAKSAESRGFVLVPITAIAVKPKSS